MQKCTPSDIPVNKKYLLNYTPENGPVVTSTNNKSIKIANNDFGRWFVRTHFSEMGGTDEGLTWYAENDPTKPISTPFLKSVLRTYQNLMLFRMMLGNCGMFFDMGLGKTIISIAYCLNRFALHQEKHFLIVCPPSLFTEWQAEITKHVQPNFIRKVVVAYGLKRKKVLTEIKKYPSKGPTFVITSYGTVKALMNDLHAIPFNAIFLDEAHKIKNLNSARTKSIYELKDCHPNASRFELTGSPSTNDPIGFYSLFEWLQKGFSGSPNFKIYKDMYQNSMLFMRVRMPDGHEKHIRAEPDTQILRWLHSNNPPGSSQSYGQLGYRFNKVPGNKVLQILNYYPRVFGNKNLDKLHWITQQCSYTLYKTDVINELPEKVYIVREIELPRVTRKEYDKMLVSNAVELNNKHINFGSRNSPFMKLHQIANSFIKFGTEVEYFKNDPKLEAMLDIIEESGDQKLLIWSPYHAQLAAIEKTLTAKKITFRMLHGKLTQSQKDESKLSFQTKPEIKVLVSNPEVGGLGLNLQCASVEIFMCNWWKPDVRNQAEDRAYRPGQTRRVTIIDLQAKGTIEVKLNRDIKGKIDTEKQILKPSDLIGE